MPQYEISIDRVWALPLSELAGFSPTNQTYVLEVIWTEEESQQWHRRRYYGVTIASRSFAAQNIESEFVDGRSLRRRTCWRMAARRAWCRPRWRRFRCRWSGWGRTHLPVRHYR